jgi:hypothetical protein
MFLILVSSRKIAFLSLIFSPCQGLKSNLKLLESRIDNLIIDLDCCLLGTHEEFEDEIKKLEVTRMVVSLLLMLQWATIN